MSDRYWASYDDESGGRDQARMLTRIRRRNNAAPLPRINGLTPDERLALEHELVDRSIRYASDHLGLIWRPGLYLAVRRGGSGERGTKRRGSTPAESSRSRPSARAAGKTPPRDRGSPEFPR